MYWSNKDFRAKAEDLKANYLAVNDSSLEDTFDLPEKDFRTNLDKLKKMKRQNLNDLRKIYLENLKQKLTSEEAQQMRNAGFSGEKLIEAATYFCPDNMDNVLQASYVTDAIQALSKNSDKTYSQKIDIAENQLAILQGILDDNQAPKSLEEKIFYITHQMASLKKENKGMEENIKSNLAKLVGEEEANRLVDLRKKTLDQMASLKKEDGSMEEKIKSNLELPVGEKEEILVPANSTDFKKRLGIDDMKNILEKKKVSSQENEKKDIIKYIDAVQSAVSKLTANRLEFWGRTDPISQEKKDAIDKFNSDGYHSRSTEFEDLPTNEKSLEELKKLELDVQNEVKKLRKTLSRRRVGWGSTKNTTSLKIFDKKLNEGIRR
jgi:hypothetical protein